VNLAREQDVPLKPRLIAVPTNYAIRTN
jgi:hypothetical protein